MCKKGSNLSRRNFLKAISASTCGAAVHSIVPNFPDIISFSTESALSTNGIFIVLNFAGGASYNTAPIYHQAYYDMNPNLHYVPGDSLAITGYQGLHPSLTAFEQIYNEGNLALINMVGYPRPDRSHATSTDIWMRGIREGSAATMGGWGARLTCMIPESIFAGVSLEGSNTLIQGDCNPPRAFNNLNNFGESNAPTDNRWFKNRRDYLLSLEAIDAENRNKSFVQQAMTNFDKSVEIIEEVVETIPQEIIDAFGTNPNGFDQRCRDAARLVAASSQLKTRFIFLQDGGYDTHSNERNRLTGNLDSVNQGIGNLITALKALGMWNNCVICTMSEFCRTHENANAGNDHGHAGPVYVMGGAVNGGIKNAPPSEAETAGVQYYANYAVDFRQIFKEIVAAMGLDTSQVFPEGFVETPLGLF